MKPQELYLHAQRLFSLHKNKFPLVFIFVFGVALIHISTQKYKKAMGLDYELIKVLVSSHDLTEGHKLIRNDFQIIQLPSNHLPQGAVRPSDYSKIAGYTINRAITKGELVLWNSLNMTYQFQSPSAKIEQGYRAVSIPVDNVSSISGMVRNGDHVDLITTLEIPGEAKSSTLTLLQNVTVLAVGESTDENNQGNNGYSTVTLMILPDEANLITHATKYGSLSMALRNPMDMKTHPDLNIISDQEIVETAFRNRLQTIRDLAKTITLP